MAITDRLNLLDRIVDTQGELIDSFGEWVRLVKLNDLEEAAKVVILSNALRIKIKDLRKEYVKLSKKSGIILANKFN
jgi:hypothetical protein